VAPGDIVDLSGRIVGKHEGIVHYTVGQRRGLNLSARDGENNEPLYVIRIDAANKHVVVGPKEALAQTKVHLREFNWLGGVEPESGIDVTVKLRSAQPPVPGRFALKNGDAALTLFTPTHGVAPGQAGVVYDGDRVLGGGWIVQDEVFSTPKTVAFAAG
jgi:tRNA-specific 2-thiouridylase